MELSVQSLVAAALNRWRLVAVITVVFSVAAVAAALMMRPVYRSEVVVMPVADDAMGGLGGLAGQFGGLAALAGISVGKTNMRDEALGVLRSRALVAKFIERRDLLPVLFEKKWDAGRKQWRSDVTRVPTMGDALHKFDNSILQVREDLKTGLITVRVDWYDRAAAADWANGLVALANDELRARTITDASAALAVLQKEIARAESLELRTAIARLMESQLRARTLASVRREYMFRVVDPAIVADPDKRVRPTRALIAIAGFLSGLLIGVVVAFLLDARRARA